MNHLLIRAFKMFMISCMGWDWLLMKVMSSWKHFF